MRTHLIRSTHLNTNTMYLVVNHTQQQQQTLLLAHECPKALLKCKASPHLQFSVKFWSVYTCGPRTSDPLLLLHKSNRTQKMKEIYVGTGSGTEKLSKSINQHGGAIPVTISSSSV